jgi:gluconate 2-dehydrogenase gamma chain
MLIGGVSASVFIEACKSGDKKVELEKPDENLQAGGINRMKEEKEYEKKLLSETFFNPHEMATIGILADIIIPKDNVSGSATDAKVPDFIEFIVKDMPEHQTPMRGGLRWLDLQCLNRFNNSFRDCTHEQQMQMVDEIAWPKKAKPEMRQGVAFFNLMRNLTASGFYTTEIGFKDVGYIGNAPNQWNGVPADVLKQYNMAYTEKELKECVSFDTKA